MYVPTPPPPSPRARELADYLSQVVDAYHKDHPELTAEDVRQALELNIPSSRNAMRAIAVGLGGVMALAVVGFFLLSQSGEGQPFPWAIVAVVGLAVIVMAAAIIGRKT